MFFLQKVYRILWKVHSIFVICLFLQVLQLIIWWYGSRRFLNICKDHRVYERKYNLVFLWILNKIGLTGFSKQNSSQEKVLQMENLKACVQPFPTWLHPLASNICFFGIPFYNYEQKKEVTKSHNWCLSTKNALFD